jgi:hypothetical protein
MKSCNRSRSEIPQAARLWRTAAVSDGWLCRTALGQAGRTRAERQQRLETVKIRVQGRREPIGGALDKSPERLPSGWRVLVETDPERRHVGIDGREMLDDGHVGNDGPTVRHVRRMAELGGSPRRVRQHRRRAHLAETVNNHQTFGPIAGSQHHTIAEADPQSTRCVGKRDSACIEVAKREAIVVEAQRDSITMTVGRVA